jgi:hypothetical protein
VFGNGETGRVPPPGAVVIASYQWTVAEAANLGANALWGPATDKEPGDPKRPALIPTVQFRNPIACAGGQPSESLAAALSRLAAEFGASQQLIELANQAAASTLDGIDLAGILPPASAVTLLDFECLARSVPGTQIARARAWVDMDPVVPGVRTPGAVTVVVVPQLPADRPEPTPGLIARVATYLHARRPLACRVAVIGPQYVPVRMQVKIHVTTGAATHMRPIAEIAIRDFLHPLRGGPAGAGWPFGRTLHAGELLRVLGMTEGVEHVSGLQIAGPDGVFTQTSIAVPAQALLDLVELNLQIREDA